MKIITQEHPMGCGVACVAAVAGVSYKDALAVVKAEHAIGRGFYCAELVRALKELGQDCSYRKAAKEMEFPEGSIVFVRSTRYPNGHYLVRFKDGWMNPWKNYPSIAPAEGGIDQDLPGIPLWVISSD
jgi:hypothetical protein